MLLLKNSTVIKRNLSSLYVPTHPNMPNKIMNTPDTIKALAAMTMVLSFPNELPQSFDSILLCIPMPSTATPQT